MSLEALIILIIVGAIAGWLAGIIVKGIGFGLVGNIIVGIVGAFIGSWLLGLLGVYIGGGIIAVHHQRHDRRRDPVVHHQPGETGVNPPFAALTASSDWPG